MKKYLSIMLIFMLVVSISLAGCVKNKTEEVSTDKKQTEEPKQANEGNKPEPKIEEVKVGAIFPLTGPAASTGVKLKYAVETAMEIINGEHPGLDLPLAKEAGLPNLGNANINFIFADHQANPEVAKSEAERLIQNEKVSALVGCYHSSSTKPASQVAERYKVPFVAGSSSSAALTERGLKYFTRIAPNDDMETEFFFEYLKDLNKDYDANIKKVGVVYIDNEYGVHASKMVDKWLEEKYASEGFEKVIDVKYPKDLSNVDTEVQKLKETKPDVILHASYIGDFTQFVKKYKEFDVVPKAVISYCGGFQDPQFVINLGNDADYFSGSNACTSALFGNMEVLSKINEMYKEKSGVDFDGPSLEDFASAMVVAEAINEAGNLDSDSIMKILKTKTFDAPYFTKGKIKFGENGQNDYSASVMVQLQNGIYEAVWPAEFKTTEPKPSFPEWNNR